MNKTYEQRLITSEFWTSTFLEVKLARAGFIQYSENDVVVCPFCHVGGFSWLPEDDPLTDHMKWNPNGEFFDTDETVYYKKKITYL